MFTNLYAKPEGRMGPIKRIKWWFRRRAYIRQRAKHGFSNYDVWDFDAYLAEVIAGGLEYLAEHHNSYPDEYSPELWGDKLSEIAKCFRRYNEEIENPLQKEFDEARVCTYYENGRVEIFIPDEIRKAYLNKEVELYHAKMTELKRGFDMLYEVFPNLWD
jgi:hypothetical protein